MRDYIELLAGIDSDSKATSIKALSLIKDELVGKLVKTNDSVAIARMQGAITLLDDLTKHFSQKR